MFVLDVWAPLPNNHGKWPAVSHTHPCGATEHIQKSRSGLNKAPHNNVACETSLGDCEMRVCAWLVATTQFHENECLPLVMFFGKITERGVRVSFRLGAHVARARSCYLRLWRLLLLFAHCIQWASFALHSVSEQDERMWKNARSGRASGKRERERKKP